MLLADPTATFARRAHAHLGGLIVDGQCELFNRIDVAVTDDGDERQTLIEEILRGPQGVSAAVFDYLDDPLSFARFTLHDEHNANSARL
jgi:hypothetical protein